MKVSIILGDRRERSEQREPRMGGNRSERSLPGSVRVTQSRRVSFVLRLTFVSLPYRREGSGMEVIKGEGNTRAEPGETEEGGAVHGKKEPEAGVSAPLLIPRRYAPLRHRPFPNRFLLESSLRIPCLSLVPRSFHSTLRSVSRS